jgi:hypothetical protein
MFGRMIRRCAKPTDKMKSNHQRVDEVKRPLVPGRTLLGLQAPS